MASPPVRLRRRQPDARLLAPLQGADRIHAGFPGVSLADSLNPRLLSGTPSACFLAARANRSDRAEIRRLSHRLAETNRASQVRGRTDWEDRFRPPHWGRPGKRRPETVCAQTTVVTCGAASVQARHRSGLAPVRQPRGPTHYGTRTGSGRRNWTFSRSDTTVSPSGFWKSLAILASSLFAAMPVVAVKPRSDRMRSFN